MDEDIFRQQLSPVQGLDLRDGRSNRDVIKSLQKLLADFQKMGEIIDMVEGLLRRTVREKENEKAKLPSSHRRPPKTASPSAALTPSNIDPSIKFSVLSDIAYHKVPCLNILEY